MTQGRLASGCEICRARAARKGTEMTDQQMMTLALAVLVPLSLLLLSNSRVTDAKETLRADIQTLRTEMNAKHCEVIATLERIALQVKAVETNLETKLKIHEPEHHR